MSKKSILKGTIFLTFAGLATKVLGLCNRIFLTNAIGVYEIGIYQMIFPIYILAFSFCGQGITTTLSKQIAYYYGKNDLTNIKKILKFGLFLSVTLGCFISSCIAFNSSSISSRLLKNEDCKALLATMILAIPFVCIKACISAYFIGIGKAKVQGILQLEEQIVRISSALIMVLILSKQHINAYMAVIAVMIGEFSAMLLAIILFIKDKQLINVPDKNSFFKQKALNINLYNSNKIIFEKFLKDVIPLTSNSLLFSLFSSLEAIMIPSALYYFYNDQNIAIETFGIVSGIVIPFLLFPATIIQALSTMLLPSISYANAKKEMNKIRQSVTYSISFCIALGVVTLLFYYIFSESICNLLFNNNVAGILLKRMCILCPLIYISNTLTTIQTGLDQAFKNLIYNILAIGIRILFAYKYVPIYGINAYIKGMILSYGILTILLLVSVYKKITKYAKNKFE